MACRNSTRTPGHLRKRAPATALLPLLTALCLASAVSADEYNPFAAQARGSPATDRVIVKLRVPSVAGVGKGELASAEAAARVADVGRRAGLGLQRLRGLGPDLELVRVQPVEPGDTVEAMLARLRADPAVEYAEPDGRVFPHRVPDDPGFAEQWFLQATVPGTNGPTASALDAVAAWDVTLGSAAVAVAVLDTGVRFDHPDLQPAAAGGKLLPGFDFVGTDSDGQALRANDGDGWDPDASDPGDWVSSQDRQKALFADCSVDTSSWHGTRVSGMLAGLTGNGVGIAGVGWQNRILPLRVLGKCGGYDSDVIAAMRWAAGLEVPGVPTNPTPARVVNLSLGSDGSCGAAYQAAVDEVTARGVLVVVSAGNDGSLVDAPANCRGAVAVTGVRHVGTKVGFASLGPNVTLAAPGGNCVNVGAGEPCLYSLDTTVNFGTTTPGANGYTDRFTHMNVGTSFAAPLVAGVAALMYSVNGSLPRDRLVGRLQATARPFPVSSDPAVPTCHVPSSSNDVQLAECNCTTSTCGAGLLYAPGAVNDALRPVAVVTGPATGSAGQTVTLSGRDSVGANGRTVTGHAWTLVSGDTSLVALTGEQTSFVVSGAAGTVVVRLAVTDDAGRTDTVDKTVTVNGGSPPPPPPPPSEPPDSGGNRSGGGGGGPVDPLLLALLGSWAVARRRFPGRAPRGE